MRLKTPLVILAILLGLNFGFAQNSEILADSYYKKGEFKKALVIYENLNKEKPYNYKYHNKRKNFFIQLFKININKLILI